MMVFPILPDWYSLRGYAKFQQEDFEGAIKDYDKAYRLGADVFNAMNFDNKIFIKYYLKDYKGALQDFDTEIKNSDNEYEKDALLWDKAQFLYNIGKYTDALGLYTQLLSKADSDSVFLLKDRLYLERAQIYQKLGQKDLAQEDLNNSESQDSLDDVLDAIPKPTLILNEL
jgi:tetratricopeptide (TPR) repeat protein